MDAPLWLKLDPKTLLFSASLLCLFMSLVALAGSRVARDEDYGFRAWSLSTGCGAVALFLYVLRGNAPIFVTYTLANAIIVWVPALALRAYARLFSAPHVTRHMLWVPAFGSVVILGTYVVDGPHIVAQLAHTLSLALQLGWTSVAIYRGAAVKSVAVKVASCVTAMMAGTFVMRAARSATHDEQVLAAAAETLPQIGVLAYSVLFVVASSVTFFWLVSERQRRESREQARRDGLTGLYNRAAFFELAHEHTQATGAGYAIAMVDIDHFKRVNDQFGHQGGDYVLAHAARLVAGCARGSDIAARYGGEEFIVLLPGCDLDQARRFGQRLVEQARAHSVRLRDGSQCQFTLSVGVAVRSSTTGRVESIEDVIARGDDALYVAKRTGRDKVEAG